jgi:hypothetical protein
MTQHGFYYSSIGRNTIERLWKMCSLPGPPVF